jgi:hypothetical protein
MVLAVRWRLEIYPKLIRALSKPLCSAAYATVNTPPYLGFPSDCGCDETGVLSDDAERPTNENSRIVAHIMANATFITVFLLYNITIPLFNL